MSVRAEDWKSRLRDGTSCDSCLYFWRTLVEAPCITCTDDNEEGRWSAWEPSHVVVAMDERRGRR